MFQRSESIHIYNKTLNLHFNPLFLTLIRDNTTSHSIHTYLELPCQRTKIEPFYLITAYIHFPTQRKQSGTYNKTIVLLSLHVLQQTLVPPFHLFENVYFFYSCDGQLFQSGADSLSKLYYFLYSQYSKYNCLRSSIYYSVIRLASGGQTTYGHVFKIHAKKSGEYQTPNDIPHGSIIYNDILNASNLYLVLHVIQGLGGGILLSHKSTNTYQEDIKQQFYRLKTNLSIKKLLTFLS
eukprot:TRINITY_DN5847_c1_g1_i3.p1 TRINITY_DN5847_c1_g1~~TRINITY_DN5847_c1_g1_i3.p1  ORF type:complete len:237 (+),score=-14.15 TRINITY_DN5847_c1_g1_i3:150-860(+)